MGPREFSPASGTGGRKIAYKSRAGARVATRSAPGPEHPHHLRRAPTAVKMKSLAATLAFAVAPAYAGLRFGCSTLTIQRLDPIVEPAKAPSAHLHHIVGGNAFTADMKGDIGSQATCTTCEMSEDFSNYWTAVLYFKHPTNGTYARVPVVNNAALARGTTGGLTVYYTQHDFSTDNLKKQFITAFPVVRWARPRRHARRPASSLLTSAARASA